MKKRTSYARTSYARRRAGLTLMEVMLVLVILGILGSMAAMFLSGAQKNAMKQATATEISTLKTAVQQYHLHMFQYPTGQDGLQALVEQPSGDQNNRWKGPYIEPNNDLKDPWMNAYEIETTQVAGDNQGFIISSAGPDGSMGTEDDVRSTDQI